MTDVQAVRLPRNQAAQLGPLRTLAGIDVCEAGDAVWLRVVESSEELQCALRSLPAATLFLISDNGQLREWENRVPRGFLPEGPWERFSLWFRVELPSAALAGRPLDRVSLRLVRDSAMRDANALLTASADWAAYAETAPQPRLDRWRFAASKDGEVLVRGLPLPPLPGMQYVEAHGIAVPCGWRWSPDVDADVLATACSISGDDVLLWRDDGRTEWIPAENFVRASRSAIRLSAEEARHG